jgi:epsilon-lactone hydrolase
MSRQQRDALDQMLRNAPLDLGGDVSEQRPIFAEMLSAVPVPSDVHTDTGMLGPVPVVTITIDGIAPHGTILYFHGGAYAIGTAALAAGLASEIARRAGARAIAVDYALAPERPYPAAFEDAVAAYRALLGDGVPAGQIVIAGESAGGGLAVAATVAIGAAGLPRPAAVYVASPWADLTTSGDSMTANVKADPSVTPEGLRRRAGDYAAGRDLADPGLSPLFADLTGFPPLLIQVGGNEVLLDDATRLAAHAAAHQVAVTLEVTPGVPHVFVAFPEQLDEASHALDNAGRFLSDHIAK